MNELYFIELINKILAPNQYLGDDCAFLEDLDIFVTHDTLVQDVHFSMYTTSAYMLGRKSVAVNLSDLSAAISAPKYITISLSMPKTVKEDFVKEFYRGVNDICSEYGVKVIGGDLTASDKIVISVCAIGKKESLFLSSRKFAKQGDYVVATGHHGSSSIGFYALSNFLQADEELINSHINPTPRVNEGKILSNITDTNIAVMDSSDGLVDALYKIAEASKHSIEIDINKVPVSEKMIDFCNYNNLDYKEFVKWGGEDFELIACVPEELFVKLDKTKFFPIGKVINKDNNPVVLIKDGKNKSKITKDILISQTYSHFINLP